MMAELEGRDTNAAFKFYKRIQGVSDVAAFSSKVWETRVHRFFRSVTNPTRFPIYSLDDRSISFDIELCKYLA